MRSLRVSAVVAVASVVGSLLSISAAAPAAASGVAPSTATDEPSVTTRPYVSDETLHAASDNTDPAWLNASVTTPVSGSADVDVPASGWAAAGTLPVSVARPASGAAPGRVHVRMLSQAEVAAAGGRYLGFEVTRADGGSAVADVAVAIDYAGIAKAYGGDFASRLRLVRVVDCSPGAPCTPPVVATTRAANGTQLRAATVPVEGDPAAATTDVENTSTAPAPESGFGPQTATAGSASLLPTGTTFTAMTSASGPAGDYSATPLSASEKWAVGVGSGGFTYSYPVDVPPAVAGPAPALSFDYSSQAVDGRTSAQNGQTSKVGEGWSFEPGFIERKFHSCRSEAKNTADQCWSPNNEYYLHFMGQSAEMVRDGTTNEWRLRGSDPAWRILSFTGGSNGDNDGEYFVVITPDGTRYWFGYGTEPHNTPTLSTNSTLNAPVYGSSSEPCYSAVSTASWCQQAYRWNVDRVLDLNNNVTSLFYAKETNYYAREATPALGTKYDRSGYLTKIEYGLRNGAEDGIAYGLVQVSTMDRCAAQASCAAPTPASDPTAYPDVPLDLMCTSATSCSSDQSSPTFWSTKEITSVATSYWSANSSPAQYQAVSRYDLDYSLPPTGDSTSPSLWLKDIFKTGDYGAGSTTLPGLRMTGINMHNRVNSGTGVPPQNKYRVATVSTDLGARYNVTYGLPDTCPQNTALTPATNPYDCYPVWYDPHDGVTTPAWIPFYKYVVTSVLTQDFRGNQPDRTTEYTYLDTPAWHYDDSLLADAGTQSWSDYRGYSSVKVHVLGAGSSEGRDTRYQVFRGMYGDRLTPTTSKTDALTDSTGASFHDLHYLAGLTLETRSVDGTDGVFAATRHRYWAAQTVNGPDGWQSHDAQYVRELTTVESTKNLDSGLYRDHITRMTYDAATGSLLSTSDEGTPGAGVDDDACTKLNYTNNTTTGTLGGSTYWIVSAPYQSITYAGGCGSGVNTVVERTDLYYDGHAWMAAPTAANVTASWAYAGATRKSVTNTTYDALGRVTGVVRPNEVAAGTNGVQTTSYSPASGYPYNGVTTTDVLGHHTTTVYYSAFGTPRTVTDMNGNVTNIAVDHLGRTTSVTMPDDAAGTPSLVFAYDVGNGINRVTTKRLLTAPDYVTSYEYVDGLGRSVQIQQPGANDGDTGRRITMTSYDPLGQKISQTDPFHDTSIPGANLAVPTSAIPQETRYGYDSAGRVYAATHYASDFAQFSARTNYRGLKHIVTAPVRGAVDYATDVFGHTTQVVEHNGAASITTNLEYNRLGDLTTVTAAAGNLTSYAYDWMHRRTSSTDPDQGTWSTTYDDEGNVLTTTDAKNSTLTEVYDRIGRHTSTNFDRLGTPERLVQWTYDSATIPNGTGRLASATRASSTISVTGYDVRGRPTGRTWDVGAGVAGVLAGVYTFGYSYNSSDMLVSTSMPAAGGLAAETVTSVLNQAGLPVQLTSNLGTPYVASTTYDNAGRLAARALIGGVSRSYTYEPAAARLATIHSTATVAGAMATIEDLTYGYDDDSNVTSVADAVAVAGGAPQRECFRYDQLDRLTTAFTTNAAGCTGSFVSSGPDPYDLSYTYDSLGDITSATNAGVATSYSYTGTTHAHAPVTIGGSSYDYDANGATISRPAPGGAQTLNWGRQHQLSSVESPGTTTSFVYDADGNRLVRTTTAGSPVVTTTTLYLDGMELTATGSTVTATRYYGSAMRTTAGVTVLLHNRQNSTTTAYDTAAQTVTYQRYTPYGARRGAAPLPATDHRFLNQAEDDTGLIATGARYYDPAIGRFTSVDPLVDLANPQSLAGYSYALNNPATLFDPTGLVADDPSTGGSCQMGVNCDGPTGSATTPPGGANTPPAAPGSPGFVGPVVPVNTWAPPEFIGPVSGPVIRDPANWCLVGAPLGTTGPCGSPPATAEYDSKDRALAVIAWFSTFGGPVSTGASVGTNQIVYSVAGTTTKLGKFKVGSTRYVSGLDDLRDIIGAERLVVATRYAGRAFIALQFATSAADDWTHQSPDVMAHSTMYRIGHSAAAGGGAALGGYWGAVGGGALVGFATTSETGPGAVLGAIGGAIVGGIIGAAGGQRAGAWTYELVAS
jgi:RHS repeat-associated protein